MENDVFAIRDKVVVVTGGMGQLGTQFTRSLAQSGSKVAIFDIVTDGIQSSDIL